MDAYADHLRDRPGHGEDSPGLGAPRLAGLFGSLPFRQLAGPAAVFLFWPPTQARNASPGRARSWPGSQASPGPARKPGWAWRRHRRGVSPG